MAENCICSGAICVCGAEGVVKDGASVRVSSMTMDAAPAAPMSIADRAASSKYDNVRGCVVSGMPAEEYYAALDAAAEAPGAQRAMAARDAAYEGMCRDMQTAYRSDPVSKTQIGDSIDAEADRIEKRVYADCIAAGHSDAESRREASYQAWGYRSSNAWKR